MCFSVPSSTVFTDRSRLRSNRPYAMGLSADVDRAIPQSDGLSYTVACCTTQSSAQTRNTKQQSKKSKTATKRRRDAERIKKFMERKIFACLFPYSGTTDSEFHEHANKNAQSEQIVGLKRKTVGLKNKVNVLQKEISNRKNVQTAEKCIQINAINLDNFDSLLQKIENLKSECLTVRKALHEERQNVKTKNIEISELQRELKAQKAKSVQQSGKAKQETPTVTSTEGNKWIKIAAKSRLPEHEIIETRTETSKNGTKWTKITTKSRHPGQAPRKRVYYGTSVPPNFNNRLGLPL